MMEILGGAAASLIIGALGYVIRHFQGEAGGAVKPGTPTPTVPGVPTDPRLAALLELGKQILRDEDHDGVADIFQRGLFRRKAQPAAFGPAAPPPGGPTGTQTL